MKVIRDRLGIHSAPENGLTLIEIIVAMMIFSIIATGVLYTMMSLLSVTRDSRARLVATNLAAEEIDLVRDYDNVFDVLEYDPPREAVLNGDTFIINRQAEWVSNPDDVVACGAGVGTLRYKQVRVTVSWENMRDGVKPVTSDTLLSPNSRINDPERGTILVTVKNGTGEGVGGIPVTATKSGSPTLSATTDAHGCAYLLMVDPGDYDVGLSSPSGQSYVDNTGDSTPVGKEKTTVAAGKTGAIEFAYDRAGEIDVELLADSSRYTIPNDLNMTLMSTRDPVVSILDDSDNPSELLVFPWPDGNALIAGNAPECLAHDPQAWSAAGSLGPGTRPDPVAAPAGGSVDAQVRVGAVTVTGINSSNRYFKAVSQNSTPLSGQPGCATEQVYFFDRLNSNSPATFSLPFGSWRLYSGNSASNPNNSVATNSMTVVGSGSVESNVVTLDPRVAP